VFYDTTYARPTNDWLFNEFWPWFRKERRAVGVGQWTRRNDCDNFARAYCVFAQDAHAAHSDGAGAEAVAVGEFCYVGSSHVTRPHAIVCAFTEDGLIFIEPQTGQRLALTPQEILTCFHAAF
jgi:hypothetical protein